jgi:hypothetical protein
VPLTVSVQESVEVVVMPMPLESTPVVVVE